MIVQIMHSLHRKSCLNHAKWSGAALFCCECKEVIALRYRVEGEVKVFVYPKFQRFAKAIENREDTAAVTGEGDILVEVVLTGWDDFLYNLKSGEVNVPPVQTDGGRVCESG